MRAEDVPSRNALMLLWCAKTDRRGLEKLMDWNKPEKESKAKEVSDEEEAAMEQAMKRDLELLDELGRAQK